MSSTLLAPVLVSKPNLEIGWHSFCRKGRIYSYVAPPLLWARGHHDHQNMAEVRRCQFLGWGLKRLAVPLTWTLPLGTQQHAVRKSGHVTRPRACVLADSPSWSPNSQHPCHPYELRIPQDESSYAVIGNAPTWETTGKDHLRTMSDNKIAVFSHYVRGLFVM